MPDEHGLGLDPPGALGEAEQVEVQQEGAGHRRAQAEAGLRE